jgi:putative flavoprotein involved in K+ transport
MPDVILDVAVIGAGQAGLGISCHLKQLGYSHVVIERGRVGDTWRRQRWDSFRLNSPNTFSTLPFDQYAGDNPDGFSSAPEFVSYLEGYVRRFELPVLEHAVVALVRKDSSLFLLSVTMNGAAQEYAARQVVIASGGQNVPAIPALSRQIHPSIHQRHSGDYRSPGDLPDGAVLVVGSAQTGVQIAEDLLDSGRRVYLSTSAVGRAPRRYRGRDILEWLLTTGFYEVMADTVTDPSVLRAKPPQVSGIGPLGHTVSLQSVARQGAVVVGRALDAAGTRITLKPDAADHVRFGDGVSVSIKNMIDAYIADRGLEAPLPEEDAADEPDIDGSCASTCTELDFEKDDIHSIVWATGFGGNYDYLKCGAFDPAGNPVHSNGISPEPGLFFLGLPWLRKRKSGFICGIPDDAAAIASAIAVNNHQ